MFPIPPSRDSILDLQGRPGVQFEFNVSALGASVGGFSSNGSCGFDSHKSFLDYLSWVGILGYFVILSSKVCGRLPW